jgi:hypothetical protein
MTTDYKQAQEVHNAKALLTVSFRDSSCRCPEWLWARAIAHGHPSRTQGDSRATYAGPSTDGATHARRSSYAF